MTGIINKKIKYWTLFLSFISIIITLVFYGVVFWLILFVLTGETYTFIRLVSYFAPWLIAILLSFIPITFFIFNKKRFSFSILILSIIIFIPYSGLFFFSKQDKQVNNYKLMTYSKMGRNHNMSEVANIVIEENPDLLFIQEIFSTDAKTLIEHLKPHYQDRIFFLLDKGLILSRFVIHVVQTENKNIIIKFPELNVRVWNVHFKKSFFNTDIQYKQVELLVDQIAKEEMPMIVAGDFNATKLNYPYIKIKKYLDNAFEQAGFGFGFTFPSPARGLGIAFPFMRIDHIFYSQKHFNVHNAYVLNKTGGSDHYPLIALVSFKS